MYNVDEIKEQFSKVIQYSQGIKNPKIDDIFSQWETNKKYFIDAFGGKLIYEYPEVVRFELGEKERFARINDFIDRIDSFYENGDLAFFLGRNVDGFFDNKVVVEDKDHDIPIGMKLLKAFKYFEDDPIVLDTIQTEASRIIQEDKIEGRLCISVHPLDYLSSSENTFNWRSCHALDGEYRCGNLSYMGDATTVIIYLRDEKTNHKLPHFPNSVPWNSKKWRMLLHISEEKDMMFAGRQYPFFTKVGLDFVLEYLIPAAGFKKHFRRDRHWSPWSNCYITSVEDEGTNYSHYLTDRYIPIMGTLTPIGRIVHKAKNSKHYDDILYSNVYKKPYYSTMRLRGFDDFDDVDLNRLHFEIGSKTTCLHCGEGIVDGYDMMICPVCDCDEYRLGGYEDYITCECCGTTIYRVNASWVNGDNAVCDNCAETETEVCARCGERHWSHETSYNRMIHNIVCRWCNEDITFDDDEEDIYPWQ